jgi:transcriptional regulator with XRE-family HTH domain
MINLYDINLLDKKLKTFSQLGVENNWLTILRKTLGIPLEVLCDRAGIKNKQSVYDFEKNEIGGKITIENLRKIGDAMGLELVYGFKKKDEKKSLADTIYNMALVDLKANFKSTDDLEHYKLIELRLKQLEAKKLPTRLRYSKARSKNEEEKFTLKFNLQKYCIELRKEAWENFR